MEYIIYVAILAGGFFVGYQVRKKKSTTNLQDVEKKAEKLIAEAKNKQSDILMKSQDKALKIIEDAKKEEKERHKEIKELQNRLEQKENTFSQKILSFQDKQQKLFDKINKVEESKNKIKEIKKEQIDKLEKIAGMSKDDAEKVLLKNVESQMGDALLSRIKKMEEEQTETLEEKAKDLMASTMQRLVSKYTTEITTTSVELPNDEMKGRIIGREGRNIKSIETLTGTEIIVDDTPNTITVSGFSPIRRHIAKRTLDKLILDGRIHPTKIENAIEESKKELAKDIKKAGEEALYEVGITGFDPKLVQIVGRLKYRTSYGQNALGHSLEVAHLSALIADQIGADVTVAKKAGLLHDIGKAVDHEVQGTHPAIGGDIGRKFGLPQDIIDPIETHHDDKPKGLISVIVKVADAISSARPGARQDSYERYIQRLEELEKIAGSLEGVEKTYAIQAGREVRIFVSSEEVDDLKAHSMAREIAEKIENNLKYPGEIKVNVIREMRVVEFAR